MISHAMKNEIATYEALVINMTDSRIIKTALELAYYTAMLDAANDDPLDSYDDQEELCDMFEEKIQTLTEKFQSLVNDKL